jgi:hypothetical protein
MRSKILIPVVLTSFLILGLFVFARKQSSSNDLALQQKTETADQTTDSVEAKKTATRTQRAVATDKANEHPSANDENTPAEQHQVYVEKRIDELTDLAMKDDRNSLDTILSELTNRDPQIRKAALDATIQFGSRDAIPKLMDVVVQVDDPKEKAEIVEAIEFLKLPSATEVIAKAPANGTLKKSRSVKPANSIPSTLPR